MNENVNAETVETTVDTEVTTDAVTEAFDAGWEGDGFTGFAHYAGDMTEDADSDDETGADQSDNTEADDDNAAASSAAEPEAHEDEASTQNAQSADQRFTLKHLDETREVSREEVIELAQKGMDYDRKTTKQANKIAAYEAFLDKLAAPTGLTREQMMDSVLAKLFQENEKAEGREVSEAEAIFKIQRDRAEEEQQAREQAAQAEQTAQQNAAAAEQRNTEMLARFIQAYPNVKAADIPQSVWDESRKTGDLLSAYIKHENEDLRRRLEATELNQKNAKRSTGSMQSAGAGSSRDDFDEGWDSI